MGAALDPPLIEILKKQRGRRFESVRRGCDSTEVDDFLTTIASGIEALEAQLHQDRTTAEVPPQSDRYSERIARIGVIGEREVEKMLEEAKAEAATIAAEAGSNAERIRSDAQGGAKRSVEEARAFLTQVEEDAKKMLSGVVDRRRQMIEELRTMREHLLRVGRDLDLLLHRTGPDADVPGGSTSAESEPGS